MLVSRLTARQQTILSATVRHYVRTAEPVGSKALAEQYDLSVSAATIRNAMGVLERAGLLYQPHTSAGRVPSEGGYRLYVDQLMEPDRALQRQTEQQLSQQLPDRRQSLEALLRGAAQILASLSGYLSLITFPLALEFQVRYLQLVAIAPRQVLLVVVNDSYQTQSAVLHLPELEAEIEADQLERQLLLLSNFLNQELQGRSLQALASLDWCALGAEIQSLALVLQQGLQDLEKRWQPTPATSLLVCGLADLLRQPEFNELQQVQALLELLEGEQTQLLPLMLADPAADQVRVRIGSELPLDPIRGCSLVSAFYCREQQPVGSVSLIGPTRMLYENAVAAVEATASYLSEAIAS